MMAYALKSIFYTLQGEGAHTGRPAVFARFAGCNLWTGLEADRASAICSFCDTEFVGTDGPGGGKFGNADELADAIRSHWPARVDATHPAYVVCTGGEPLLQVDEALVAALHERGFQVAVETNGTKPAPLGLDWICVSPKAGAKLVLRSGHELKLVYPQQGIKPEDVEHLEFDRFYLQPMDGPEIERNTEKALAYCKQHPKWRLSVQTHKWLNIP